MVDQCKAGQSTAEPQEKPELLAARAELETLEQLAEGVSATISELVRQRPNFDPKGSTTEFALHELRYTSLKGYEELAHHCYGRTVLGVEIDDEGHPLSPFAYRITQANVGYIAGGCNVLARNSPIASKLVSANPGDETEVNAPKRTRYLTANEVRTFDGPVSLLSPSQKPNFRSMVLRSAGREKPLAIQNLRSYVLGLRRPAEANTPVPPRSEGDRQTAVASGDAGPQPTSREGRPDPTWFESWQGVYLGDSETTSLGHQFFTRTTREQENALNNPRGLTFVEGIAGAGKTSVALGRLKFFSNFSTGEQLEHYGLQNAAANDFSPVGMVGFVLSHSLKRYLKETATALGLERLPIRDFQEFRTDLSNQFGLTQKLKRSKASVPSCRTRLAWLLAVDAAMARVAGVRLREAILRIPDVLTPVREALLKFAAELANANVHDDKTKFHLSGLAQRVVTSAMEIEFRAREASIRERLNREISRNIRVDLETALDQIRREEESQVLSTLARRLIAALPVNELYFSAVQLEEFPMIARQAFGDWSC